ncbi:MAG TPA: hypothetical protein VN783_07080 [Thermoanaerobaculia bacterium]|nr:hypothetical protein [Thermoanaerobaculia bacterium]
MAACLSCSLPLRATALAAVLALSPLPAARAEAPAGPPASPEALADQVLEALGGQKAWEATRYLHFTFAGRRSHWWDRYDGRHRVEGKTKEGQSYVVLENLNTREGTAYLDGKQVEGDELKKYLELGYGTWVNDTYWLIMPYKLRDPGVHLALAGEETIDGTTYDKLALSFDHVGLTPGDHYWAYVNRTTHLMDRWAYLLEDAKPGEAPTAWLWKDWQKVGGILLAPTRVMVGSDRTLPLGELSTAPIPDGAFTSPAPLAQP